MIDFEMLTSVCNGLTYDVHSNEYTTMYRIKNTLGYGFVIKVSSYMNNIEASLHEVRNIGNDVCMWYTRKSISGTSIESLSLRGNTLVLTLDDDECIEMPVSVNQAPLMIHKQVMEARV